MAISRDTSQDCSASNDSTNTLTATFAATATTNKLLIALGACAEQAITVGGPSGWSKAIDVEHNSQTFSFAIYYKISDGTETGATFTTGGTTAIRVAAYQYSGMVTSLPLDKTAAAQSGGSLVTTLATGTTATTTQASELIITGVHLNGNGTNITWTNGTELVELGAHGCSFAERIVSSTATYNDTANWTGGLFSCAAIATFKASTTVDADPTVTHPPFQGTVYRM